MRILKKQIAVHLPTCMCDECLEGGEFAKVGGMLAGHCPHNMAGSMMRLDENGEPNGRWITVSPVTPEQFAQMALAFATPPPGSKRLI